MSTPFRWRGAAAALGLAVVVAACDTGSGFDNAVLFGDEQEPAVLNSFVLEGATYATVVVAANVWPGMYRILPDFSFEPYLLDGEADVTEDPFTVTYRIREDAVWSDGAPISSDDVIFTYETIVAEEHVGHIVSTDGYDRVERYERVDDKTVTFEFSAPYAPWKLLFGTILPAHVLEGEDFLTVLNDSLPEVSGGPFVFDSWDRGTQLVLTRNDAYWNGEVGLDALVFRYLDDVGTLTQQVIGGEIDMYAPLPQTTLLDDLEEASDRLDHLVGLSDGWEHLSINTRVPGLDRAEVRRAIALGIDREEIVEALVRPIDPSAVVLDNPFWMTVTEHYQPHYARWSHDPAAAIALLEGAGCERGTDGIFECDGTRLAFRIGTTGGNEQRELTQTLIQRDLAEIGIEITVDNDEGTAFFGRLGTPEQCGGICDFDLALVAWGGYPNPAPNANIFGCDDGAPRMQNFVAWCDTDLTALMDQANTTVDTAENAVLWNQAAERMADAVPLVPLYQQPQVVVFDRAIGGVELNPTAATLFWNSGEWTRLP